MKFVIIVIAAWFLTIAGAFVGWYCEVNRQKALQEEAIRNYNIQALKFLPKNDWDKPVLWKQ